VDEEGVLYWWVLRVVLLLNLMEWLNLFSVFFVRARPLSKRELVLLVVFTIID
jgi:hypothetical protein